ncbi:MAG: ferredoxin family protein [Elusimicrobiota bacterium]
MDNEIFNELKKLSIEEKLYLNQFNVDNNHPHVRLKNKEFCQSCEGKPCLYICPVENYKENNGEIVLSWEGCLECGSCRIACKYGAIEWNHPRGGFGIKYRYG